MTSIYQRRYEEAQYLSKQVADILRTHPDDCLTHARAATSKLPGDALSLRGIPALARGVGGAMRGTRPGELI